MASRAYGVVTSHSVCVCLLIHPDHKGTATTSWHGKGFQSNEPPQARRGRLCEHLPGHIVSRRHHQTLVSWARPSQEPPTSPSVAPPRSREQRISPVVTVTIARPQTAAQWRECTQQSLSSTCGLADLSRPESSLGEDRKEIGARCSLCPRCLVSLLTRCFQARLPNMTRTCQHQCLLRVRQSMAPTLVRTPHLCPRCTDPSHHHQR